VNVFRDWKDWQYWQYTDKGVSADYGMTNGGLQVDLNWFNGSVETFKAAYCLDPVSEKIAELERLFAGLQVGQDTLAASIEALKVADEQLKDRVMSAETAIGKLASVWADDRTWLQKLDTWAKGISLK
jgi:hypothetical protein